MDTPRHGVTGLDLRFQAVVCTPGVTGIFLFLTIQAVLYTPQCGLTGTSLNTYFAILYTAWRRAQVFGPIDIAHLCSKLPYSADLYCSL